MAAVVDVQLRGEVGVLDVVLVAEPAGVGRVVAQLGVLHQHVRDVDAEAVGAAVEPEAQHVEQLGPHLRVAPVEVGLLLQVRVEVVLPGRRVELPDRSAGLARPVVGRPAVGRRVGPDVPVALGVLARGARGEEPGCWSEVWLGT